MSKKSNRKVAHKRRKQQHAPLWQRRETLVAAAVLVIGVVLLIVVSGSGGSSTGPDFTASTLDGETVRLEAYRGQVVMLNFWATWCPPCRAEMPDIQSVYNRRSGEGFSVLAINNAEGPAEIRPFVTSLGLSFPVVMDQDARIQRQFDIRSYPTSIFIDGSGEIYATHSGMVSAAELDAYIDQGLARGA